MVWEIVLVAAGWGARTALEKALAELTGREVAAADATAVVLVVAVAVPTSSRFIPSLLQMASNSGWVQKSNLLSPTAQM